MPRLNSCLSLDGGLYKMKEFDFFEIASLREDTDIEFKAAKGKMAKVKFQNQFGKHFLLWLILMVAMFFLE